MALTASSSPSPSPSPSPGPSPSPSSLPSPSPSPSPLANPSPSPPPLPSPSPTPSPSPSPISYPPQLPSPEVPLNWCYGAGTSVNATCTQFVVPTITLFSAGPPNYNGPGGNLTSMTTNHTRYQVHEPPQSLPIPYPCRQHPSFVAEQDIVHIVPRAWCETTRGDANVTQIPPPFMVFAKWTCKVYLAGSLEGQNTTTSSWVVLNVRRNNGHRGVCVAHYDCPTGLMWNTKSRDCRGEPVMMRHHACQLIFILFPLAAIFGG